jgi:hypothetical protein
VSASSRPRQKAVAKQGKKRKAEEDKGEGHCWYEYDGAKKVAATRILNAKLSNFGGGWQAKDEERHEKQHAHLNDPKSLAQQIVRLLAGLLELNPGVAMAMKTVGQTMAHGPRAAGVSLTNLAFGTNHQGGRHQWV